MLTYPQWLAKQRRRERLLRYGGAVAGIIFPALVAWIVVSAFLGGR